MLLKQLVVKGFKSFADKTEVSIPEGITMFVGPNGCGKSNVSDAIRWVMGEQNPRNLRGMKMQDMIFAGAETRKAESMAEVSLVFDNPDGFFNLPHAEVMITRRLYRSGESEYLINKTPVRLKDILELFMDTGLGHHSYTLIEQGRVEHMLSSKPADRLAIFEEAAGVTRYKARRDEALRKLHRAEQDLLRLNDIEEELGKQSRSLRRQAQQASRHKRLVEEMQALDQIIASREGRRLATERAALEKQMEEVSTLLQGEQTQITAIETRQTEVSLHIDGFTARLREQHENYHRLQMDIQKRESQLAFLKETKTELAQRRGNLEREIEQNQSRRQHLTTEIENKRIQIQTLEQQEQQHQEQYQLRLKSLEQIRADRRHLDQQLESVRNRLWEIQKSLLSCRNEMQQIQQQKDFLDSQDERALREKESLEQQLESVSEARGRLSGDLEARRQELEQTATLLSETQKDLAQSDEEIARLNEQLRQEEKLLDQYRVRRQLLEQLDQQFEGYGDSAKFVLKRKAGGESPFTHVHAPLAEILSVEKGFEAAVEAALAARLECLIVDEFEQAAEIISCLSSGDCGRVLLLCKDLAKRCGEQNATPNAEWRCLSDFVTCSEEYSPIVSALVNGVALVENLQDALALMHSADESGQLARCAVTPRGEVVAREGWLAGGRQVAHGVLARKREQSDLATRIAAAEVIAREISETLGEARSQREQLAAQREQLRERQETLRADLRALEQEQKSVEREVQRLQAGLNTIARESEERLQLREAQKLRLTELDNREQESKNQETQLQAEFGQMESQLVAHESALRERETQHREAELAKLSAKKDLERFRAEQTDLQSQYDSLERRITQANQEIVSIGHRSERADVDTQSLQQEIASLISQSDGIHTQITESETSLQDVMGARDEVAHQLRTLNETHAIHNTAKNDLEKSILRVDMEMKNLEERIQQEFDRPLEEVIQASPEDERSTEILMESVTDVRRKIGQLGEVNPLAIQEFEEVDQRLTFLHEQRVDLEKARASLLRTIETLQKTAGERFHEALETIRENFRTVFRKMFRGGKADLVFIDLENNPDGGIEIVVQPPGKQLQNINLLSGGEKALSAIALLFAMYLTKPSPFCLFDEVDAPLDDQNIGNFCRLIQEFSERSQFLIISHNKRTMEMASTIYGVTMETKGISKILSLQMEHQDHLDEEKISAAD